MSTLATPPQGSSSPTGPTTRIDVPAQRSRRTVPDRLDRLVDEGVLTADQLAAVRAALVTGEPAGRTRRQTLALVAGYAGGALAFAAVAVVIGTSWSDLGQWGRTALFAAVTAALGFAAWWVRSTAPSIAGEEAARTRTALASTLATFAAATFGLTAGVAFNATAGTAACAVVGGSALAAAATLAYVWQPTAIAHVGIYVGVIAAVAGLLAENEASATVVGASLIAVALCWAAVVLFRALPELDTGLALALLTLYAGSQVIGSAHRAAGITLIGLAGAASFACYLLARSSVLLVGGVLFVTAASVWALTVYAPGSVAAPLAMLAGALVLLTASMLGLRMRRGGGQRTG